MVGGDHETEHGGVTVTTAARRPQAVTDEDRASFARLLTALPFDPARPPDKLLSESAVMYLARVFDLGTVHAAHAEGRKVDEASDAVSRLVLDARDELTALRRTAHLAIVRSVADGKVPKVDAKAVAALAAARDRSEYLVAASSGNLSGSLYSVAADRAAEAIHAMPVTTAAQVVTLAAVLRTHEAVRVSVGLRPTADGRPTAAEVLKVVSHQRPAACWTRGKDERDRQHIAAVDYLAREWADGTLEPAIRERVAAM